MKRVQASRARGLLTAFADPVRLRILNLLRGGELCVGDIVAALRLPQPTASRHLGHLRRARLVTTRRQGLWMFYSLADAQGDVHSHLLACLECCLNEVPELRSDLLRAGRLRDAGSCCPPDVRANGRRVARG